MEDLQCDVLVYVHLSVFVDLDGFLAARCKHHAARINVFCNAEVNNWLLDWL